MARIYAVLLTDEGHAALDPVLEPYWSDGPIGRHLYCKEASPDRNFFHVMAQAEKGDGSRAEAEIYIPHRFIRVVIATTDHKHFGFV